MVGALPQEAGAPCLGAPLPAGLSLQLARAPQHPALLVAAVVPAGRDAASAPPASAAAELEGLCSVKCRGLN